MPARGCRQTSVRRASGPGSAVEFDADACEGAAPERVDHRVVADRGTGVETDVRRRRSGGGSFRTFSGTHPAGADSEVHLRHQRGLARGPRLQHLAVAGPGVLVGPVGEEGLLRDVAGQSQVRGGRLPGPRHERRLPSRCPGHRGRGDRRGAQRGRLLGRVGPFLGVPLDLLGHALTWSTIRATHRRSPWQTPGRIPAPFSSTSPSGSSPSAGSTPSPCGPWVRRRGSATSRRRSTTSIPGMGLLDAIIAARSGPVDARPAELVARAQGATPPSGPADPGHPARPAAGRDHRGRRGQRVLSAFPGAGPRRAVRARGLALPPPPPPRSISCTAGSMPCSGISPATTSSAAWSGPRWSACACSRSTSAVTTTTGRNPGRSPGPSGNWWRCRSLCSDARPGRRQQFPHSRVEVSQ